MSERTRGAVDERYRYEGEMEDTQAMRDEDLPRRGDRSSHSREAASTSQFTRQDGRHAGYDDRPEPTVPLYREPGEERGLVDEAMSRRAAEREERARMLGVMSREGLDTDEALMPVVKPKRTTDKWHGSLAFFLLRLVTAGVFALYGFQHLTHLTRTKEFVANSLLPQPSLWVWGFIITEFAVAALLVFGLLTRLAGLAVVAWSVVMVAFFDWGTRAILTDDAMGFKGEFHVVLAVIGLVFFLLGAGGWGVDHAFRHARNRAKQRRDVGDPV